MVAKNETNVWISKVEQEGDELVVCFEKGMMESLGWKPGDVIIWSEPDENGTVTLKKLEQGA